MTVSARDRIAKRLEPDCPIILLGGRHKSTIAHPINHRAAEIMRFNELSFGSIRIDGVAYDHDVVIDRGEIRRRKKKPSKQFRAVFGHTPLSLKEEIPWKCHRLVVGIGGGAMPVMDEVKAEAKRRKVELIILPTSEALKVLNRNPSTTNAVLHVTC